MSVRMCGHHTGEQYVKVEQTRVMYSLVLIDSECDDLKVRGIRCNFVSFRQNVARYSDFSKISCQIRSPLNHNEILV